MSTPCGNVHGNGGGCGGSVLRAHFAPRWVSFTRSFPATAEYLADELRTRLARDVTVIPVTGNLPPEERAERIRGLDGLEKYVLVCTDCLSEGINLQQYFDAVLHYDLAWNPTRHEQREGRVDRFGQVKPEIKVVTYYGVDNQIDGLVLEVLIRKQETIRKDLGISVPVPASSNAVLEALYEGLLLKGRDTQQLLLFEDVDLKSKVEQLDSEWKSAADREKRSRALFAQHKFDDRSVAQEVEAIRSAIGSATDVETFVSMAVRGYGGTATRRRNVVHLDLRETPPAVREAADSRVEIRARFELPVSEGEVYLSRTHPLVEGLASYAMESALDPVLADKSGRVLAARCGAIRTKSVETWTTLLLVRFRYHILTTIGEETRPLLAEDCQLVAFSGTPDKPDWLPREATEALLTAEPDENIADSVARSFIQDVLDSLGPIREKLDMTAKERGQELLAAHKRVRQASHRRGVKETIEPQLPPDILGLYVYLPAD